MFLCSLPEPGRPSQLEHSGRRSKGYLTSRRGGNSGILFDSACRLPSLLTVGSPIERFEAELSKTPERIALREIGETFVLPL